mgnify:CR=1 FL=1
MESVTFKTNDPKKQIELAPIILFCYNRVEYLIQTVMALRANELADQSDLRLSPRLDNILLKDWCKSL